MQTLPLAEVRSRLFALVDEVARDSERILITRKGAKVAVLMSADELAALEERLARLEGSSAGE
jgi:prevent-host-death family protein